MINYINLLEQRREINSQMQQAFIENREEDVEKFRKNFIELSNQIRSASITHDETPTLCDDFLEPGIVSFHHFEKTQGHKEIKDIIAAINKINLPLGVYALMYKAVRESEHYILKHIYASRQ